MVNPFTLQAKVSRVQKDVLRPLYTEHDGVHNGDHNWLLAETGRAIATHQSFIEEVCRSRFVAAIFKIVKLLGGADKLTAEDFDRFTSYVNDGGIKAMIKMLLSVNKEKVFISELRGLPPQVRQNAPQMLRKSSELHQDFITGFFKQNYGRKTSTPEILLENYRKSDLFICKLAELAQQELNKSR